jgi:hypothetical protein
MTTELVPTTETTYGVVPLVEESHWTDIKQSALEVLSSNKTAVVAHALSQVLLGVNDEDSFYTSTGVSLSSALADSDVTQLAENLAGRQDNQERAERIKLKQAQAKSLAAINHTLDNRDASPAQIVACNDALIKIQSAMESDAFYVPKLTRSLRIMFATGTVETPISTFSTRVQSLDDLMLIVNGMCCVNEAQIDAVVRALKESAAAKFIGGSVTLGW